MNNYQDQWGRYHDKPTDGVSPSSNNGWIFTAYASKVGLELDYKNLSDCFSQCVVDGKFVRRTPSVFVGPFVSRDECLGTSYLGLLKPEHLNGWNFSPFPLPKLDILKFVKELWSCKGKHRNYFWQNNLTQVYRVAYMVPLQDRYSILKWTGRFKFYRLDHLFYAGVSLIDRMGKPSGIRYLKYGGEKNMRAMVLEFPEDHPIRVKVGM